MSQLGEIALRVVAIGIGATVLFDGWLWAQQRIGLPTMNFALLGRWVGHLSNGTLSHPSIANAAPVRGEMAIGWIAHYCIGIVFAALLLGLAGSTWVRSPTFGIALLVGMSTVVAPLFVLQPAMGAGIASTKTPTPLRNCVRSIVNHTVFGIAMYAAAVVVSAL